MTGALPRVEHEPFGRALDRAPVRVPVQNEAMLAPQRLVEVAGIVDDQDGRPLPDHLGGRLGETQAQAGGDLVELVAQDVVVAVDPEEGHAHPGQRLERRAPGDVAGVDDPIDARSGEDLDDAGDVPPVVVGIADDTDPQGTAGARPGSFDVPEAQTFSRTWIAQALPRPITWVRPSRAPSTWRLPASPRRCVATS